MAKYPSLFLDTESIKAKRSIAQRQKGDEDFYSSLVCRPFTIYVTLFLLKYTKLKANDVTFFMAIISVITPFAVYFIETPLYFFITTFVLYMFILFLDVLDGEMARLNKQTSELGVYVDSLLWFTLDSLMMVFLLKINEFYFQLDWLVPIIYVLPFVKLFTKAGWVNYIVPNKPQSVEVRKVNFKYYIQGMLEPPSLYLYFALIALLDTIFTLDLILLKYIFFILVIAITVVVIIKKNITIISYLRKL